MGTKYSSVTVSGYNSSPPSDDGSATEANKVKWSTVKTKLNDPVKTAVESINTALVTAFDYGPSPVGSSTTLSAAHHDKYIEVSSAVTVTLPSAATVASGYVVHVYNASTGVVTIARAGGGDTIDGTAASLSLAPRQMRTFVVNDGDTGFLSDNESGYVFIEEQTASASATLDFASAAYAAFDWIEFRLKGVYPATDGANLYLRFSTDSGSSYISSSDYAYSGSVFSSTPAASAGGSTVASAVVIAPNVDNGSSASGVSGTLRVRRVNGSCQINAVFYASTGEFITAIYGGQRGGSTYNAFRFLMSSGNITGGSIAAYGVKS